MSEETSPEEIEYVVVTKKRSPLRRIGCGLLLVVWFTVLMLPLFLFILAVNGEIRIGHSGDMPDKHEHPLLELSLVMEADFRGLRITNAAVAQRDGEDALCVQTNVRYLLWQGEGDPATFCDCYARAGENWELTETLMGACGDDASGN